MNVMLIRNLALRQKCFYFAGGELRGKEDGWPLKCLLEVIKVLREVRIFLPLLLLSLVFCGAYMQILLSVLKGDTDLMQI